MYFKPEVNPIDVAPSIWIAIGIADLIHWQLFGTPCTVTSLRDSHADRPNSLHNNGQAADLRTKDLSEHDASEFKRNLLHSLPATRFRVILETRPRHLHIETATSPAWQVLSS